MVGVFHFHNRMGYTIARFKAQQEHAMIYDVHTHIGLDVGFFLRGWWPYAATVQDLTERMDRYGVDRAVCFPFTLSTAYDHDAFASRGEIVLRPGRAPFDRENALLLQEVNRIDTDRRLRVLGMFDPAREVEAQVKNLQPLVNRLTGLKLQGTVIQANVRELLGQGRPLMELAQEHDLPVLIHTSINPADKWAQAADCLDVAEAFPNVRFNLAHSLRYSLSNLKRAATLPNVWIDCSAHLIHCMLAVKGAATVAPKHDRVDADYSKPSQVLEVIADILGKDKYLWGSDSPYMSWSDDNISLVVRYGDEVAAFKALPASLQKSMGETAPLQWLGKREGVLP